jgi:hypothetical protein
MVWTVIAIATLVAGIFIAIVVRMIINKKKGKQCVPVVVAAAAALWEINVEKIVIY